MPAEASRTVVQHLLELLGLLLIESCVGGVGPTRAFVKRLFEPLLVELGDNVSDGLIVATEGPGDPVGSAAISTCEQDLAARRKIKASGERRPAFRALRSSSEGGRTKTGSFMSIG